MSQPGKLHRVVGWRGAVLMGLGSILGTGVFVSVGFVAMEAGGLVLPAIGIGALVALCNGLSSAQLAAAHPVSGGTYAYGYRFLHPLAGFSAGWLFLLAKSASAATAALGLSGYLLELSGLDKLALGLPLAAIALLTLLVAGGLRQANIGNAIVVGITLAALLLFIGWGLFGEDTGAASIASAIGGDDPLRLLEASALMFVAYTGYGRIATLGEEITEPRRNIPKAILITLLLSAALYGAVGLVVALYPEAWSGMAASAPLETLAETWDNPLVAGAVTIGAVTAMVSVLLNLILGLSRVLLAMGRQGDMPPVFGRLSGPKASPRAAVIAVGVLIAVLSLLGDVRLTWSFSAFTVLLYYSLTNLAALRLPREARLYPRVLSWAGLLFCVTLALFVEPMVLLAGLGTIALGWLWYATIPKAFSWRKRS